MDFTYKAETLLDCDISCTRRQFYPLTPTIFFLFNNENCDDVGIRLLAVETFTVNKITLCEVFPHTKSIRIIAVQIIIIY